MKEKVVLVLSMILFLLIFGIFNMVTLYFFGLPLSPVAITGKVVDTGVILLTVDEFQKLVVIHSPLNTTYEFNKGDIYLIDLNVSANFEVEPVDGWKYSLYDLRHGVSIENDTLFTPNSSVVAVRWANLLTVYANELDANWISSTVVFGVNVPNSAPIIGNISEPILICENERLGDLNSSFFNATDVDEDVLTGDISPKNPFYLLDLGDYGYNVSLFKIISLPLIKNLVRDYSETVQVVDSSGAPDSRVVNISVIEINNPATFDNGLGAETVWLVGENSTFNHDYSVSDKEVDLGMGSLNYSLTWAAGENLFDINSDSGVIGYIPNSNDVGKTYHLTTTVCDDAISNIHQNFSFCAAKGHFYGSICVNDSFTLTVTNDNRAPQIINYTPYNLSEVNGDATVNFNVTVYDPDMVNAYPDILWYVNGVLKETVENFSNDSYGLVLACGVSGSYNVTVLASDGLLNDSQSWVFNVLNVDCPVPSSSGGGGGGGGGSSGCVENWVCDDWGVCQNSKRSFEAGVLSLEDYNSNLEICSQNQYDERFCGFQITLCQDINLCNNTSPRIPMPAEMRACYFTENPNCMDGITNCHDGSCELLVDCGGPCSPCATCSDGKQNQGETGVDCGGPCPYLCPVSEPLGIVSILMIILSLLLLLLVIYIIYKFVKIYRHRIYLASKRRESEQQRD